MAVKPEGMGEGLNGPAIKRRTSLREAAKKIIFLMAVPLPPAPELTGSRIFLLFFIHKQPVKRILTKKKFFPQFLG